MCPDFLVGASVGAINAGYFAGWPDASGIEDLARIWRGLSRRRVFPLSLFGGVLGLLSARNHLLDPRRLRSLIERNLPYENLEEAAIPLHVVATDVLSGDEVVLSSGNAADALLASASIPGLFPPVKIGGRYLADGGIANNTPISVACGLGATKVIVIPTGFACRLEVPPPDPLGMALHGISLLIARQLAVDIERYSSRCSVHVAPALCPLTTTPIDFSHADELIERSVAEARCWLGQGGLERPVTAQPARLHAHD
ncbi:MAG: patatin-like phospholipase family protein [Candidatus Dadabacteria bacterium]|nr:MAG: patatin-like phospholipase family protein [Candidatus Dadabacteria bacterium]